MKTRDRLEKLHKLASLRETQAKNRQKKFFDQRSKVRELEIGQRVLILLPTSTNKLLAEWKGPYTVLEKVSPVDYKIQMNRKSSKVFHINMLKAYFEREESTGTQEREEAVQCLDFCETQLVQFYHDLVSNLDAAQNSDQKQTDVIIMDFAKAFDKVPHRRLLYKLEYYGIRGSTHKWIKTDEVLNKLGKAKFLSKIDLTKRYWQIPLSDEAKPLSAFVTPFGQYQFRVMPFGMINSEASFVRLMKRVLEGKEDFSDSFIDDIIDDIIIFSDEWNNHIKHLECIPGALKQAHLTAKPSKCFFAFRHLEVLAHIVGSGEVKPTEDKISAIREIPVPTTKRKVRSLIGFLNFYRRFIPHFTEIASPLTDLTVKAAPNKVVWTDEHQQAFDRLKMAVTSYPVLRNPDLSQTFTIQTDSSDRGIGGVLLQEIDGKKLPIMFISKKLLARERH